MKAQILILMLLVSLTATSQSYEITQDSVQIALNGNAYITSGNRDAEITNNGLTNWNNPSTVISTYFYVEQPQEFEIFLNLQKQENKSSATVTIGKQVYKVKMYDAKKSGKIYVGKAKVNKPGYIEIKLQGNNKSRKSFAEVKSYTLTGLKGNVCFVKEFNPYWASRGPSVHLNYKMPKESTEWFYNEVTVPNGEEVIGSYYMANGFGEGYFGMQCNSETERRILFSVWSPFDTEDPKLIPEEDKIKVLRKGAGVHIGEFGNEGSGGQSYLIYNWKSGTTYKFLTHIKPDGKGNTIYTAFFFAPEENNWRLIASFQRPKTNVYYTNAYSFLENFIPEQGYLSRRVLFGNQFCKGIDGVWREITEASFSHDATGKAKARLDYAGGVAGNCFFLKNCGFFDDHTSFGSKLVRKQEDKAPSIDFEALDKL